ncbi:MAG: PAS domain-containing protein, partial [Anaerolineaceae bacterium]|nr:PAS domain-containing protein [Anaerolineaceae bacterium]
LPICADVYVMSSIAAAVPFLPKPFLAAAQNVPYSGEKLRKVWFEDVAFYKENPEAAAYLDMDFRVLDVNPRFCQLFGYSAHEAKYAYQVYCKGVFLINWISLAGKVSVGCGCSFAIGSKFAGRLIFCVGCALFQKNKTSNVVKAEMMIFRNKNGNHLLRGFIQRAPQNGFRLSFRSTQFE